LKNKRRTRGATGLPKTTWERNIRKGKAGKGEELTERKPKERKGRREVWEGKRVRGGVGLAETSFII
jgi:hypothetical protein